MTVRLYMADGGGIYRMFVRSGDEDNFYVSTAQAARRRILSSLNGQRSMVKRIVSKVSPAFALSKPSE